MSVSKSGIPVSGIPVQPRPGIHEDRDKCAQSDKAKVIQSETKTAEEAVEEAVKKVASINNLTVAQFAGLTQFEQILLSNTSANIEIAELRETVKTLDEKLNLHVEETDRRFTKQEKQLDTTTKHVEETDKNFQHTDKRIDELQAKVDKIIAKDISVQSSVSDELKLEKDKFERTIGLEPVDTEVGDTPHEQILRYLDTLRKLGIPKVQLDKFNILRVFRTNNSEHPRRMYAEFDSSGPLKVINRVVGNKHRVKIHPWLGSQIIYDLYKPLNTLAFALRDYGREKSRPIWTQIMFVDNTLKIELGMMGVDGHHVLPPSIRDSQKVVNFITNKVLDPKERDVGLR